MKLVLLLGVLSLLALSSTALPETSLTALHRGVRQASKSKGKGDLKRGSKGKNVGKEKKSAKERQLKAGQGKKRKGGKGKKSAKERGLKKGKGGKGKKSTKERGLKKRKGGKGKKAANGKVRKESRRKRKRKNKGKGGKGKRNKPNKIQKPKTLKKQRKEKNENPQTAGCSAFYTDLPGFRYDQNQLRKLLRVDRTINKLRSKVDKAATAFADGAEFYKDCPEGQEIYRILRFEIILR